MVIFYSYFIVYQRVPIEFDSAAGVLAVIRRRRLWLSICLYFYVIYVHVHVM